MSQIIKSDDAQIVKSDDVQIDASIKVDHEQNETDKDKKMEALETLEELEGKERVFLEKTYYASDVFKFNNFVGDDLYTINGKGFFKNENMLFKTGDFFGQQDVLNNEKKSHVLLSSAEESDRTELWDNEQKKKIAEFSIHKNAYFMGDRLIVGDYHNFQSMDYHYVNDPSPRFVDIETQKEVNVVKSFDCFFPKDNNVIMCRSSVNKKVHLYDIRTKKPTPLFEEKVISYFPKSRQTIGNYFPFYGNGMEVMIYSFTAAKFYKPKLFLYTMEYYSGNDVAIFNDQCFMLCGGNYDRTIMAESRPGQFDSDFILLDFKKQQYLNLNMGESVCGKNFVKSHVVYNGKKCNRLIYHGGLTLYPYKEYTYTFGR